MNVNKCVKGIWNKSVTKYIIIFYVNIFIQNSILKRLFDSEL